MPKTRSNQPYGSKYHANKIVTPEGKFDSIKELNRWRELQQMQSRGEISDLRRQVKIELIPTQRDPETGRVLERACHYVADATYTDEKTKRWVVEDAKGFRTPEYKLKRKMALYLRGIRIKEV